MRLIRSETRKADLAVRRNAAVPRGVATATPLFAAGSSNAEIHDTDGRRYVDFASGIGVLATGHRHPRVLEAVSEQLSLYTHTAFQVMACEPYVELAERLNTIAPVRGAAKTLLLTTGAEAVENAGEDRPNRDRAAGSDRVQRRVSRPHDDDARAHGQGDALQAWHGIARRGHVSHSVPHQSSRDFGRGHAECARVAVLRGRRAEPGGRDHHRARAGRRRFPRGADCVAEEAARDLRCARHSADRRRNPVWIRPHRPHVRDPAQRRASRIS